MKIDPTTRAAAPTGAKSAPAANAGKSATAKPATEVVEKEDKVERIPHPLVGSDNKSKYPFTVTRPAITVGEQTFEAVVGNFPKDYDDSIHQRLKKDDFASPADYAMYQLQRAQERVTNAQQRLEDALTGKRGVSDEKRFMKMFSRIKELRAKLLARGIDPNELVDDGDE